MERHLVVYGSARRQSRVCEAVLIFKRRRICVVLRLCRHLFQLLCCRRCNVLDSPDELAFLALHPFVNFSSRDLDLLRYCGVHLCYDHLSRGLLLVKLVEDGWFTFAFTRRCSVERSESKGCIAIILLCTHPQSVFFDRVYDNLSRFLERILEAGSECRAGFDASDHLSSFDLVDFLSLCGWATLHLLENVQELLSLQIGRFFKICCRHF